ncbi:MAG: NAD(P)/FAD-dependent oxidoreductase [Rhizobiaceae bacterium]|nr:NAD(P)/FAD-dependent oxidoreductase [Rhizobiaceae bacterium]
MDSVECVVVGAGAVGLASARALARSGREVVVLEAEQAIGLGTSSRSSEVIHAGIYYSTGLSKTRFCVSGRDLLYRFCEEYDVPHRRCGKLIVATSEDELHKLDAIRAQAEANGVHDLELLSREQVAEMEPALRCSAAVLSPSTGIVDSASYMNALLGDAEAHGAMVALATPVLGADVSSDGIIVETGGEQPMALKARFLVNASGLGAQSFARNIRGMPSELVPPLYLAKGNYYSLGGRAPFSRLIYPMPEKGGLGVHLTLDLGGQARFGPDVEWIEELDYSVDPRRADGFYEAIRRYWPDLPDESLQPAYAGVRPKIEKPGGSSTDFMVQTAAVHGIPYLVNLFGVESPGLTSSLAIADYVAAQFPQS